MRLVLFGKDDLISPVFSELCYILLGESLLVCRLLKPVDMRLTLKKVITFA